MSEIAQALAKAKARTGHTATPFLAPGSLSAPRAAHAPQPSSALRKAKARQRFWTILAIVALPLTGFVIWTQVFGGNAAELARRAADAGGAAVSSHSAPASQAGAPGIERPAAGDQSPETQQRFAKLVADLPISAVMPGEPARIMLSGRVVRAGEHADTELVFVGLAEGRLLFADASGGTYSRRY